MKHLSVFYFAVVALLAGVAMTSCVNNDNPTVKAAKVDVAVLDSTPNGANIVVTTSGISEFAYIQRDAELAATAILQAGTKYTISNTESETSTEVTIQGLEPNTSYKVYFAFRKADNSIYEEVKRVEFTTTGYGENTLTIVERKNDGFAIHVQIPAEVKERGNALRYSTTSLAMYNYIRDYYGNIEPDMLLYNAGQCTDKDKTIRYDEQNNYERDENGNVIEDGASYSDPKVPGEPGVFLIGEFGWMDDEEDEMYPAGWDPGYYRAMFDWEKWYSEKDTDNYDYSNKKYWTGYFERLDVMTLEPRILEEGVNISVSDLTPINACITLEPSDDVIQYCVIVCTESEFKNQIFPLINNKEEHLRWLTGSFFSMMTLGAQTMAGTSYVWLGGDGGWFLDTKGMAGQTIKVLVAGLGDANGTVQSFDSYEFTLPEVTLPAPKIIVTPIEGEDPYSVSFNIKNPDWATNPVSEAKFACNYVREYNAILKEYSYTELIKGMGYSFNNADIEQINSEKGFVFTVTSRDNETTRLAVLAYNWEGSGNNPDEKDSPAVCENTTPNANFPVRVNSSLFDELVGEWVATAPMVEYVAETDADGNATGNYTTKSAGNYSSPVTISGGVSYPETLPAEVYDLYAAGGIDKATTDELYSQFKSIAEWYNFRTRGFNRLLCLGYNFASPDYMLDIVADPYELFTATDYSVSQVSYMFYDFGPKWNLEIDKDGNVWLPLDIEREYPLETFNFGLDYTFYMLAVGQSSYLGAPVYNEQGELLLDARFPVEVSDDRNTITIKPIVYNYTGTDGKPAVETYYPCVAQLQYGYATPVNPRVNGDVVLTRKSASTQAVKANAAVGKSASTAVKSLGKAPVPMKRAYSMTPMNPENIKVAKHFVIENPIEAGAEAFHKRAEALVEAQFGIRK